MLRTTMLVLSGTTLCSAPDGRAMDSPSHLSSPVDSFSSRLFLLPALKPMVVGMHENGPYYRKGWFSQIGQDRCVAALFQDRRGGYYIDLAANDAISLSNTYHLVPLSSLPKGARIFKLVWKYKIKHSPT